MYGDEMINSIHPELFQGDFTGYPGQRPVTVVLRVESLLPEEFEWLLAYADVIGATGEGLDEDDEVEEDVMVTLPSRGFPEIYSVRTLRNTLVKEQ